MAALPTILIADDDENDVFFARRAFDKTGTACQIIAVQDGEEAVDYLGGAGIYGDRARYPFPDVLLLDLKMPKVGGIDVLRWMNEQRLEKLHVVVLSSSNLEEDVKEALALGAHDYRTKSADLEKLHQMARELLAGLYEREKVPS